MWKALGIVCSTLVLTACASLHQLSSDVAVYNQWPAGRTPGSYSFERLPSQQATPQRQAALETGAAPALAAAGFKPAADPAAADVTITLGARVTATEPSPFDNPFWWHGGLYIHHFHGWVPYGGFGFRYGWPYYDNPVYEREAAMLIRDRRTGKPLYEVHVINEGYSASIQVLLQAMFAAGMADFPYTGPSPHEVTSQLPP